MCLSKNLGKVLASNQPNHNIEIMKNLMLFAIVFALYSCKKTETTVTNTPIADSTTVSPADTVQVAEWTSKNQVFLDKFRTVELDSSRFVSPRYDEPKIGPTISKTELELFPKTLNIDSFIGEPEMFQAFLKFNINENLYGLVARMPGEYSFTSMKLFFYDKKQDAILPQFFELADATGDAGYSEETKSWLWKDKNELKSFTYHWTKVEKVEPDDPTRESRTDDYYLIKLNPEKIDTLRVSKSDLPKYQKLLNQK